MRALRGERSQAEFAKEVGITKSTLQAIEKQKSFARLDTLELICHGLDLPVSVLLSNDQESSHFYALMRTVKKLDWFASLPAKSQTSLILWFKQTLGLLTELQTHSEGS